MTDLIYLVEISAYDPALPGTRTLRYCSGVGKMTGAAETPASTYYEPRVLEPMNFVRTAFANARVTGGGQVGQGELVLNNADQGLNALLDLGLDGRDLVVRIGAPGAAYPGGYTTFLTATIEQVEVGIATATLRLKDKLALFALPFQATKYAGTNALPNGAEGVAGDIKGRPKPKCYGKCFQAEPVLVNTSLLTYQVNDGAIQAINAVYDKGNPLTAGANFANLAALEAAAPAAGAYVTCTALGLFRLGASPAGRVTVDLQGDSTGGYISTAGDILNRILQTQCGIASGSIDVAGTFAAFISSYGAEVGIYERDETTRQAVIDKLLMTWGAWMAPNRAGVWTVRALVAPSGTAAVTLTDTEIEAIDRITPGDPEAGIPVYRVRLQYKPYWAGLVATDLVAPPTITEARRGEMVQPWREVIDTDAAVQTLHLLAPEMQCVTLINDATAAATEATRRLTLHKARRDTVKCEIRIDATNAAIDLGTIVDVTTTRLGYGATRKMLVTGVDTHGADGSMILDLWG